MTTDIEEQLMAGMQQEVAGVTLAKDIVGAAATAHRRRTAVHRTAYAAGAVGLAGALAAVVAVGAIGESVPGAGRPPVASAETPQLQLAAAVAASENLSYTLKITVGTKEDPDGWGSAEGAYDPATSTGYLHSRSAGVSAVYYQRLINGVLYLGSTGAKKWKQEPGNGKFEYGDALGGAASTTADPGELFKELRQAGAKVVRTGAGTYHFETTKPFDDEYQAGADTVVGDVTVDGAKRIAKVTSASTHKGQYKPGVKGGVAFHSTTVVTVELSDYGRPVKAEKPTDVIVAR